VHVKLQPPNVLDADATPWPPAEPRGVYRVQTGYVYCTRIVDGKAWYCPVHPSNGELGREAAHAGRVLGPEVDYRVRVFPVPRCYRGLSDGEEVSREKLMHLILSPEALTREIEHALAKSPRHKPPVRDHGRTPPRPRPGRPWHEFFGLRVYGGVMQTSRWIVSFASFRDWSLTGKRWLARQFDEAFPDLELGGYNPLTKSRDRRSGYGHWWVCLPMPVTERTLLYGPTDYGHYGQPHFGGGPITPLKPSRISLAELRVLYGVTRWLSEFQLPELSPRELKRMTVTGPK
jgi:hypothetical protein